MNHDTATTPAATAPSGTAPEGPLRTGVRVAFVVSLVVFLLGGAVLVVGQAVALVLGDGHLVTVFAERLGPPTFTVATVCGLLAFVHEYLWPHAAGSEG